MDKNNQDAVKIINNMINKAMEDIHEQLIQDLILLGEMKYIVHMDPLSIERISSEIE